MFKFLREWFPKIPRDDEVFTGALDDDRSEEAKGEDIKFEELVASAAPVDWKPLDLKKLPDWPVFFQDGSSSCVAATKALMSSILYYQRTGIWLPFSFKWIYSFRKNKPTQGMIGYDVFDIESSLGLVPEAMVNSNDISEELMNRYVAEPWEKEVGKALRMSDQKVVLPIKDIETVASVMQVTNKPIMVWFRWHSTEWLSVPRVIRPQPPNHHSVTFIPPKSKEQNSFGLHNGEKAIVIQDSWGNYENTFEGKRVITESFYNERNTFAAYSMRFKFDEGVGTKPSLDNTIVSLQKCLRYEGFFPTNVSYIESFGPVTKKSLAQFQQFYGLPVTSQLDIATKAKLKSMYP